MENRLKIRKAAPEDVKVIFELIKELAEYEKLLHEVKTTVTDLQKALFDKNSSVQVLIAEFNDLPVGYALFFFNFSTFLGKTGIYLEDLFVKPTFRNKGIGKSLLESVIQIAKERDCGRVEWSVLDWNQPAIDFYESRGAKSLKDWKIFRLSKENF